MSTAWQEISLPSASLRMRYGPSDAQLHHFLRSDNLHAEALRLHHRAARQVAAAQTGRKAEIVFDARAQAGLSAGSFAIDHHRLQPFGRAIHRSRQTARAAADDGEVVELGVGARLQADLLGQLRRARLKHARAIGKQGQRQLGGIVADGSDELLHLGIFRRQAQHRSTDRERDSAPENRAPRRPSTTSACPTREFPRKAAGTMPSSLPADRR